ncbi:MAG TPA: ubiquitin-like domain-containing protein [Gemmatimonadales bacterium]|nr:ubiquitin-like domain-containing protein [Gemmatimonadales bacterium]
MTAVGERFAVRVMVTDVWDQVFLAVEPTTTVAELKRQALAQALKRVQVRPDDYVMKFRGAQVLDEATTLAALGAVSNSPFIILPARRKPVR